MPTIAAVLTSTVLLPQSNIMTAFVHSHSNLFSDVSPVLPTYSNLNVTQFTVYSIGHLLVTFSYSCLDCIRNAFVAKLTTGTHTWRYMYLLSAVKRS
jgi:hypothetical protein